MRAALLALIIALGPQALSPAVGIKETAKLTISGPGLDPSLEITDRPVLALSGVFGGTFIGTPATEPDAAWPRYVITFDIQTGQGVKLAAYVVYYTKNRWTSEGFLYLPGRGENWYRNNISTILRDGQDGKWHHASDAWARAINALLP